MCNFWFYDKDYEFGVEGVLKNCRWINVFIIRKLIRIVIWMVYIE